MHNDPHFSTFDGLRYDCMASGEFVLFRTTGLEVQARFTGPTSAGSVMTGVVMSDKNHKLPVHIVSGNASGPASIAGCKIRVIPDGRSNSTSTEGGDFSFDKNTNEIRSKTGAVFAFRVRLSSYFGCYFESNSLFVPAVL